MGNGAKPDRSDYRFVTAEPIIQMIRTLLFFGRFGEYGNAARHAIIEISSRERESCADQTGRASPQNSPPDKSRNNT